MKIAYRKFKQSDEAFIFSTYIRNRWFDKANTTTLKRATWSKLQHKRIEDIMYRGSNGIVIACLSEEPDTILGYCFMDNATPWCYIKLAWRDDKLGLKVKLLEHLL